MHIFAEIKNGKMGRVYDENGNVEQTNNYFAYGGLTNDVTAGTDTQTHKFGGKELDRMHGLDFSDFSARQYDPAICQFTSMDPLCEKYYHISPYSYCGGNPVKYVDPTGEYIAIYDGNTQYRFNAYNMEFEDNLGNAYRGHDFFIKQINADLREIMTGEFGNSFISGLATRNEGVVIVPFEKCIQQPRNGYKRDKRIKSIVGMNLDQIVEGGTAFTNLAHELAHSQDYLNGTMNNDCWKVIDGNIITMAEIYSTHVENLVRAEHPGITFIRQFYSKNEDVKACRIVSFENDEYRSLFFHEKNDFLGTRGVVNHYKLIQDGTGYVYKRFRDN